MVSWIVRVVNGMMEAWQHAWKEFQIKVPKLAADSENKRCFSQEAGNSISLCAKD
jgi:hypothetical protein